MGDGGSGNGYNWLIILRFLECMLFCEGLIEIMIFFWGMRPCQLCIFLTGPDI